MKDLKKELREYVRDCARNETPPRVGEFAHQLDIEERTLRRWCVEEMGEPPRVLIEREKLAIADELLSDTELTTAEVAYRSGFTTRKAFFRSYSKYRGHTPRKSR